MSRNDETPFPVWFKVTGWAIVLLPILFFVGRSYYGLEAYNKFRWRELITENCYPTIHGRFKKAFADELDLWVAVLVDMDAWERGLNLTEYGPDFCDERYSRPGDKVKRLQCLASFQIPLDWHSRCEPVAELACINAGGCSNRRPPGLHQR